MRPSLSHSLGITIAVLLLFATAVRAEDGKRSAGAGKRLADALGTGDGTGAVASTTPSRPPASKATHFDGLTFVDSRDPARPLKRTLHVAQDGSWRLETPAGATSGRLADSQLLALDDAFAGAESLASPAFQDLDRPATNATIRHVAAPQETFLLDALVLVPSESGPPTSFAKHFEGERGTFDADAGAVATVVDALYRVLDRVEARPAAQPDAGADAAASPPRQPVTRDVFGRIEAGGEGSLFVREVVPPATLWALAPADDSVAESLRAAAGQLVAVRGVVLGAPGSGASGRLRAVSLVGSPVPETPVTDGAAPGSRRGLVQAVPGGE